MKGGGERVVDHGPPERSGEAGRDDFSQDLHDAQQATEKAPGIHRSVSGYSGSWAPRDGSEGDGGIAAIFRVAFEDSLAITCLYAIVVCGRSLTTPDAMSIFTDRSFWMWLGLLVACNVFLQVFYPSLKQQLVQAALFSVVVVLMGPIKTPALGGP